ncbi:16S rRNA (uracil(1498)-N(3))-methyltransferase [Mycoplasmatota bacterium]|nr:16S rRNA (uracil(1498)-N(3))-methyltransferase [Mycoplasmatota bacterium]
MQRYFTQFNIEDKFIEIIGDNYHHIKHVMRMKINDQIYISNGKVVYYGSINEINSDAIIVELQYEVKQESELKIHTTIAQGMPKSGKFETVIQKVTELGGYELIPVLSERSLFKVDKKTEHKKIERFNKIAKSAAEQSHRLMIPKVHSFMSITEMIAFSKNFHYKCVAYEASSKEEQFNLSKRLQNINENEKLLIFIGPEGGLSDKEISLLKENDFQVISLGNRILRTETAPLFVMSAITYELELRR